MVVIVFLKNKIISGFTEISFKAESAKKCKKPLKGFNTKTQECLSSDADCTVSFYI